jgi:hypothetical protein
VYIRLAFGGSKSYMVVISHLLPVCHSFGKTLPHVLGPKQIYGVCGVDHKHGTPKKRMICFMLRDRVGLMRFKSI